MTAIRQASFASLALLLAATAGASAQTAACGGDFGAFLEGVRQEAAGAGISAEAIERSLADVRQDPKVLARDRAQGVFAQTWDTFANRMVSGARLKKGRGALKTYADTFASVEAETGVPGAVITSFWGLETDFGADLGDFDTLSALATLAHDCRRPELFRPHLIGAMRLVDRGYLSPREMRGACPRSTWPSARTRTATGASTS